MPNVVSFNRQPRRSNKERSEATRTRLLEATVACLFENGYAATTGTLAIQRAGLSRGAALHQFPSRVDLLLATALYIIDWLNDYRAKIAPPAKTRRERVENAIDVVWESWRQPHSIALLEIFIGARSDAELAERLPPIRKQIQANQAERFWELLKAAGVKDKHRHQSDVLVMMSVSVMRGLAIERMTGRDPAIIEEAFQTFRGLRQSFLDSMFEE